MTLYSFEILDHSDLVIYTSILDSPTNYLLLVISVSIAKFINISGDTSIN